MGQKSILITGEHSYIGQAIGGRLSREPEHYRVTAISVRGEEWKNLDFSGYDVCFHAVGIAHADVGKATEEQKKEYYRVNTYLTEEVAKKAKASGVRQFIYMSSMIVYSGCAQKFLTEGTEPKPLNFYGDSKLEAEKRLRALSDGTFHVAIVRSPMVYGKGSKGNYPVLARLARTLPVFPVVKNRRSVCYVENLAEFVRLLIDRGDEGIFFPQNAEYVSTSELVRLIAAAHGHRIWLVPGFGWFCRLMGHMPGKPGALAAKAFGDSAYELSMSEYPGSYRVCGLEESVRRTESR